MKLLTEAEYAELVRAREQRDALMCVEGRLSATTLVECLLSELDRRRLVLTVEQVPLQPLAMGHYATTYSLRERRST